MARPLGDVSRAILKAAAEGPGTALQLARRACVGRKLGAVTASRLLSRGQLAIVERGHPAVLGLPGSAPVAELTAAMRAWSVPSALEQSAADLPP